MPEDVYKLIVMFFGLTNLLAIFQMIMNNLLKDLIKIRYVVAFINDIMIEMEIEKRHNNIMEKILKWWQKMIYLLN